jgi:hypothetical protein
MTADPPPFPPNAETAVRVFNDIVSGVRLEARPRAIMLTANRVSPGQIDLGWTDAVNNAAGYRVERGRGKPYSDLEEIARLPATARSYADHDVKPDESYRYRVVAFNARGETPSNEVEITPKGTGQQLTRK